MRRTRPGNKMENEKLHKPRRRGRRRRSLHSQLEPNNRLKFLPKQSSSRSSLSQPKQKASEGLNANASQAGPDGLLNDCSLRSKKLTPPTGLSTRTLYTGLRTRTKKGSPVLSFSAPSPAPGVTHARVIHPPLNHGWEGVVDIMNHGTAEEGVGRLHCLLPNY